MHELPKGDHLKEMMGLPLNSDMKIQGTDDVYIRRVPNGWVYEYTRYDRATDTADVVTAAVFVPE